MFLLSADPLSARKSEGRIEIPKASAFYTASAYSLTTTDRFLLQCPAVVSVSVSVYVDFTSNKET